MNVRIIAGAFGGRTIEGSGTDRTHPMGERVRSALFNKISDDLEGAAVLDAFAGSGALGLEALSRGAASALFVEKDHIAQRVIDKNIAALGAQNARLIRASVASWLTTTTDTFDVIFADPPYHNLQLSTTMQLTRLLKPNGLMVLSYPGKGEVPPGLGVVVVDNRSYGNAALAFYRKER